MAIPLITYPYITRTLSVNSLGLVNFSSSIVNYFILLAGMGYSTYAIREGAKCREDKEKFQVFANEVFSMNIITMISSLLLLFIVVFISKSNYVIYTILSLQIVFSTIGQDWINTVYEEFVYITGRTILFQICSVLFLFLFVKNPDDIIGYSFFIVFATIGANIANYFYIKNFCNLRFTIHIKYKNHIKPILLLFFSSVASTIYTNLDVTMLGIIKGDYQVGIYSTSLKIYNMIKQMVIAFIFVYEPRITNSLYASDGKYSALAKDLIEKLFMFIIPTICGTVLLSKDIIYLLAGAKYAGSANVLVVLSIGLVFPILAYFYMHIFIIPYQKELNLVICSMTGAFADAILNSVLIPHFGTIGAAVSTVIAEMFVMVFAIGFSYKARIKLLGIKYIVQLILGAFGMSCSIILLQRSIDNLLLRLLICTLVGGIIYIVLLLIERNNQVIGMAKFIKVKITKGEKYE